MFLNNSLHAITNTSSSISFFVMLALLNNLPIMVVVVIKFLSSQPFPLGSLNYRSVIFDEAMFLMSLAHNFHIKI